MKITNEVTLSLRSLEEDIQRASMAMTKGVFDHCGQGPDDYANEMRLKAWQALKRKPQREYALKAVWNQGRDMQRRSRRHASLPVLSEVDALPEEPSLELPLGAMVDVQNVWSNLPDHDKDIITSVLEGHSFREMAQELPVSDWTLRRSYRGAVQPLREVI